MIGGCNLKMAAGIDLISQHERRRAAVRCEGMHEPTFLEGFHDAVETAVFAPDGVANPAATQRREKA
jgi:hypothetical protein